MDHLFDGSLVPDNVLENNPVPPLRGNPSKRQRILTGAQLELVTEQDLDDFGRGFNDVDPEEQLPNGSDSLNYRKNQAKQSRSRQPTRKSNGVPPSSFHKGAKSVAKSNRSAPNRKRPSASNRADRNSKKKKKSTQSDEEVDSPRPDSDKNLFNPLQKAKQNNRLSKNTMSQQQNPPDSPENPPTNNQNMSGSPTETVAEASLHPEQQQTTKDSPGQGGSVVSDDVQEEGSPQVSNDKQRGTKRKANTLQGHPVETEDIGKYLNDMDDVDEEAMNKFLLDSQNKDKKIKTCDRLKAIAKCRKMIYMLKSKATLVPILRAQNDAMEKQIVKMKGEIAELEESANTKLSRSQAKLMRVSEDMLVKINEVVKDKLWRICKFVSCPAEEEKAAQMVLDWLKVPETEGTQAEIDSWIETYKKPVKKALYACRNYLVSEMKKSAFKVLKEGNKLPTSEEIRRCATRNIPVLPTDGSDPDEETLYLRKLFKWYWEELLPRVVGATEWGKSVKYYTTIQKAKRVSDKRALIPVSHEAMLVLVWENNYEKWPVLYEHTMKKKDQKQPVINGKYTVTDGGQNEWGGWLPSGLTAYNKYKKEVKAARKNPKSLALEKQFLKLLREEQGIIDPNHDAHKKRFRAKKQAQKKAEQEGVDPEEVTLNNAEPSKIVCTMDNDSDEED